MPIRIKPTYDLNPCLLDFDSIKEICALVEQNFSHAKFSAEDGIWEVFNEDKDGFISAISPRETLDSFTVSAKNVLVEGIQIQGETLQEEKTDKVIKITFDEEKAEVAFTGQHELENWFGHFIIDLKKHLNAPQLRQRLLAISNAGNRFDMLSLAFVSLIVGGLRGGRYCLIILHKRPPNAFVENIKANLVSNLIWVVFVFVTGIIFTLLSLWIYRKYGLNINEWLNPSIIPSSTPAK